MPSQPNTLGGKLPINSVATAMMGASVHNGANVTNIPDRAPSRKAREIAKVSDGPGLTLADKPNEIPKIKNVSIRLSMCG